MPTEQGVQDKRNGATIEQVVDPGNAYQPEVDIVEDDTGLTLFLDLPGVGAGGAKVEVDENNILTLRAKNSFAEPSGGILRQSPIGDYYRAFQLGPEYSREKISAQLREGVLLVRIPKKEDAQPRRIEISA